MIKFTYEYAINSGNKQTPVERTLPLLEAGITVADIVWSKFHNSQYGEITRWLKNASEELENWLKNIDSDFTVNASSNTQIRDTFSSADIGLKTMYGGYIRKWAGAGSYAEHTVYTGYDTTTMQLQFNVGVGAPMRIVFSDGYVYNILSPLTLTSEQSFSLTPSSSLSEIGGFLVFLKLDSNHSNPQIFLCKRSNFFITIGQVPLAFLYDTSQSGSGSIQALCAAGLCYDYSNDVWSARALPTDTAYTTGEHYFLLGEFDATGNVRGTGLNRALFQNFGDCSYGMLEGQNGILGFERGGTGRMDGAAQKLVRSADFTVDLGSSSSTTSITYDGTQSSMIVPTSGKMPWSKLYTAGATTASWSESKPFKTGRVAALTLTDFFQSGSYYLDYYYSPIGLFEYRFVVYNGSSYVRELPTRANYMITSCTSTLILRASIPVISGMPTSVPQTNQYLDNMINVIRMDSRFAGRTREYRTKISSIVFYHQFWFQYSNLYIEIHLTNLDISNITFENADNIYLQKIFAIW